MTQGEPRYAIYFVPARDGDLHRFGCAMLGYDCYSGAEVPMPLDPAIDPQTWRELTEEPRRYGFHATLKAPFRLAPGCDEAQLARAVLDFARRGHAPARIEPEIRLIGTFAAIVARAPAPALATLVDGCVTQFDAFRAPMPAEERGRRAAGLSGRQLANLDRWGYPYVFADFRFHMTLTGRLPPARQEQLLALLRQHFERMCGEQPIAIDRLGLFKQEHPGARFRVLCHEVIAAA